MTIEEAIEAVRDSAEGRGKKFNLDFWADIEIQRVINTKRWWWRKKLFTLTLAVSTSLYDLTDTGNANAGDFLEMVKLMLRDSDGSVNPILRQTDSVEVHKILAGGSNDGDPSTYIIEPGTTQQIRFDRGASSAKVVAGTYWAAYNPTELGIDISVPIPIIPPQFHYIIPLRLTQRMFMFLYGQEDPRYPAARAEAKEAMAELHAFKEPSSTDPSNMMAGRNPHAVQSTR